MKKTATLLVLLITFLATAHAQIPNASFESWTTTGGYSTPDGWDNYNALTAANSIYTCEKGTTGAPHGSSFIMLTTKLVGSNVVPGMAMSGKYDVINKEPKYGFPYTGRPASLTGKWQYMAMGNDTGRIAVYLTKWNTATSKREYVGGVEYDLPGMVMAWAPFSIPITYATGATPDSVMVGLVSSNTGVFTPGSYLYVDSLNFAGTVAGIPGTKSAQYSLTMSPNPATDNLSIDFGTAVTADVQLWVIDMYGIVVAQATCHAGRRMYTIDLDAPAGLYFVKLKMGADIRTQRLVIQ